jgi:thiamine pyrophosphokinase
VVAADGGVDVALELGLPVSMAIGDFDSVSSGGLEAVTASGVRVERHASEKDATDLELALDAAVALGPRRIVVVGDAGGRLDHLVAGLLLLASPRYETVEIDAFVGPATAHVVRRARTLRGTPGETVSVLAVNGPAEGVTTAGLVYPLRGETLLPGSSRGVSNLFGASDATITVDSGTLVVLRPGLSPETTEGSGG